MSAHGQQHTAGEKKSYAQVMSEAMQKREAELNALKTDLHNMRASYELCVECQAQAVTELAILKAINDDLVKALEETQAWLSAFIAASPTNDTAKTREYKARLQSFAKSHGVTKVGTVALSDARAALSKARGES